MSAGIYAAGRKMSGSMYQAAIYVRISKEDPVISLQGKTESNSISNQKELILNYIKSKPDITVTSIHVDDGFSGASFRRPAFQRMLIEIESQTVNCVVVKDLSRFGRNYIEAGRYIERIFPLLGVRFIAINDNIDSADKDTPFGEIMIPFKNLVNDAYCRDISVKIRSHLLMKRRRGEYIGAFAVYGYRKAEENKNQLVMDFVAAQIVKKIYHWKMDGYGNQAIADVLNENKILSPMEYKRSLGMAYETSFKTKDKASWTAVAVSRILKNEVYTGTLVQGKESTLNYKVTKRIKKKPEEWIRVEGAHEAIIDKKEFAYVQKILLRDTRTSPQGDCVYVLGGFLFCGDCKSSMIRKTISGNGKKYIYYICSGNKKDKSCSSHRIPEQGLVESIFLTLISMLQNVIGTGEMIRLESGLDRSMVVIFINHIIIYENQRVEIKLSFQDIWREGISNSKKEQKRNTCTGNIGSGTGSVSQ